MKNFLHILQIMVGQMVQVPKRSTRDYSLGILEKMESTDELRIENKKNDRFLIITRKGEEFEIKEVGYLNSKITVDRNKIRKSISEAIEREFPRSNFLKVKLRKIQKNDLKIYGR